MPKITPFLWFDGQVEEAMTFYTSVFQNAKVLDVSRDGDGNVFSANFQLEGQEFIALNGGPRFTFTPAVSFFITCANQEEVDRFWAKLSEGGEPGQCGWLKDKFGLSWQVVPRALGEMLQDEDAERGRVMNAMMKMGKLDIKTLTNAFHGK